MSLWQETSTVPLDLSGMQHPRAITVVECLSRDGQQGMSVSLSSSLVLFSCFHLPFCFSPLGLVHHPMESQHTSFSPSLSLSDWLRPQATFSSALLQHLQPPHSPAFYPRYPLPPIAGAHGSVRPQLGLLCFTVQSKGRKHRVTNPHHSWWDSGQLMLLVAQTHVCMIDSH